MADPAAAAATPPPTGSSSQQPAAPPTSLEQRQWRRGAQTALRLALTATKAARSRGAEASAEGTQALTALTNALLEASYLPSRPLGVLADAPGLVEAGVAKLRRRAAAAHARLHDCWRRQHAAAQVTAAPLLGCAAQQSGRSRMCTVQFCYASDCLHKRCRQQRLQDDSAPLHRRTLNQHRTCTMQQRQSALS